MAKKIVRGITDVKTINNQDFDTNNVNDLLSDGQYNYIHRKKGKDEEYHNLTDNIKTISSDNTELLSVTNNNKTTNSTTLHPKHDAQKEQVLESTRNTISIHHGTNGTDEKTTVDTNPQKVLEHENLRTAYGISKATSGKTTTLGLEYTRVQDGFNLNDLLNGCVRAGKLLNAPTPDSWYFVSAYTEDNYTVQEALTLDSRSTTYKRTRREGVWGAWREQVGDKSILDTLLAQKQDKLTAGDGITIQGQTISATGGGGGGSTITIQEYVGKKDDYTALVQVVRSGQKTFTTFAFECYNVAQSVLTGKLKTQLEEFVPSGFTFTNGAVTITNDGTDMKLINSTPSDENYQHGTFTFRDIGGDDSGEAS